MNLTSEQVELACKLTDLQRNTVLNIMSGMSNRQAYVKAGSKAKTEPAQDAAVYQLLCNVVVKEFHDSLKRTATIETASKAILTRAEALELLTDNARVSDEKRDQHQAIKQLSTMEGWDAPKKTQLSGPDGKAVPLSVDVSAPEVAGALSDLVNKL